MNLLLQLLLVILISYFFTAGLRRYALSRNLVDVPGERTSHLLPTPRGGGVSIVFCYLGAIQYLGIIGLIDNGLLWGLTGGGLTVAIIGFYDDHGHIPARWRLCAHFFAAFWLLYWIDGLPAISFGSYIVELDVSGYLIGGFYLVWMLNLYNFMDGINGIASIQAICVSLAGAGLFYFSGSPNAAILSLFLAAAVTGFAVWNFPKAKIFMGDAGSGFLGFIIAALTIYAAGVSTSLLWSWLILCGVFIVDTSVTLLRRLMRREKLYEAHRSHAYQFASRLFNSHVKVTVAVALINILWLFPWSLAVSASAIEGWLAVLIAYLPLIIAAMIFQAGKQNEH